MKNEIKELFKEYLQSLVEENKCFSYTESGAITDMMMTLPNGECLSFKSDMTYYRKAGDKLYVKDFHFDFDSMTFSIPNAKDYTEERHLEYQDRILKKAEHLQNNCHSMVGFIGRNTTSNIIYQDSQNVALYKIIAELTIRIEDLESKLK